MKTKLRETLELELQRAEMQKKAANEEYRKSNSSAPKYAAMHYWVGYCDALRVLKEKIKH